MLSIQGYFDGKRIVPLEAFPFGKHYKVTITFDKELAEDEEVRLFASQTDSFTFWENPAEDVYNDYLVRA